MKKQLLLFLFALLPMLAMADSSGKFGDNLTWTYTESTGTLTIQGSGYMWWTDQAPWYSYKNNITSIVIGDGVKKIPSKTFWNYPKLTSVSIGNSVTLIGESAFANCKSLISIVIPNSVERIETNAFYNCSSMYSVTFGNGLTYINEDAFMCPNIKKVIIPDIAAWCKIDFENAKANPLTFAHKLFSDKNTQITKLVIPDNVMTSIGNYAFNGCSNLISATIGNNVTSIGSSAFSGCSGLTSVTIPNSVESIGSSAFSGCSGLTSLTLGNSVTSIDEGAFSDCSSLASVTFLCKEVGTWFKDNTYIKNVIIGDKETRIADRAFEKCTGLTSVTIGSGVTSIGGAAFAHCSGLKKIIVPDLAAWCGIMFGSYSTFPIGYDHHLYKNEETEITSLEIPEGVTSISSYAFYGCRSLTSVTIPNSVTSIGVQTFSGCTGLTSFTIGKNITSIGDQAFLKCSGLTTVTFHCPTIGTWFRDMPSIKEITIGEEVTSIGSSNASYGAFQGCTNLSSITIPNNVTVIGNYTFSGCSKLSSVTMGNSVKSIGKSAFYGCSDLRSITIPNSVKSIGEDAFKNCSKLKKVIVPDIAAWCGINFATGSTNPLGYTHHIYSDENTEIIDLVIPDGATSIGNSAFYGCSSLTSVTIPNSVESIGNSAFYGCSGLTSVTIPNSVTSFGEYAFSGCTGLTSVTIGNSVTYFGESAFLDCSGLTSVTLLCKEIRAWFSGFTSIKEVVIGNEVTSIAQQAFAGCSGLQKVYSKVENVFTISNNTFDTNTYSKAKLYVPIGMKTEYEDTPWWLNFTNIEEYDYTPKYKLSYMVDGIVYKEYEMSEGSTITPEAAPTKEGYTFSGWSEIPETMPAHDVTVTGTFSVNKYTLGDINSDQKIDVSDYIGIANHILGNTPEGFVMKAADVNEDGLIDVSDYVGVANIILTGSIYGGNANAPMMYFEEEEDQEVDPD